MRVRRPTDAAQLRRAARGVARARFFDLAGRFTPALALEEDGVRVWMSTSDTMPGRLMFARGVPERGTLARACAHLGAAQVQARTFLDVGAHIGTATLAALRWQGFGGAVCFEPNPDNARLLRQNLLANDVMDRVDVVQVAVSDGSDRLPFELAPENTGDGRVRIGAPRPGRFEEQRREVVEVAATTLDRCVADGTVALERVGLVWIDAQGHEGQILSGATRLLEAGVPMVVELWPYGLRRSDGLDLLCELAADSYSSAVDLRDGSELSPAQLPAVAGRLRGIEFTDILLRR
jgi:FkbM family methyltransferase